MRRRTFIGLLSTAPGATAGAISTLSASPAGSTAGYSARSWPAIRERFPLDRGRAYLNTGGLGPPARDVLEAVREQEMRQAVDGEHHHADRRELRAYAAAFFGADPEEFCFTRNTTEGNSIIAAGLDLKPGDEVLFESHAHPGGSFPWLNRQKLHGVKVKIFDPDPASPEGNLDRIFSKVTPRTRVVQVSHITAPTGLKFDAPAIAAECRRRGIWFHVDGAQCAGMIPIDLRALGCDSYAACGHKWLNGPQETGVLYIARDRIPEVRCSHLGSYSNLEYELPDTFSYWPEASRHEYGTRNTASVHGLRTALEFQEQVGRKRIAARGKHLAGLTRRALEDIPGVDILTPERGDMHGSILTFKIPGRDCREINRHLGDAHNLRCRIVTERDLNAVRTSWHVYNDESEVERLAAGVRDFLKRA